MSDPTKLKAIRDSLARPAGDLRRKGAMKAALDRATYCANTLLEMLDEELRDKAFGRTFQENLIREMAKLEAQLNACSTSKDSK